MFWSYFCTIYSPSTLILSISLTSLFHRAITTSRRSQLSMQFSKGFLQISTKPWSAFWCRGLTVSVWRGSLLWSSGVVETHTVWALSFGCEWATLGFWCRQISPSEVHVCAQLTDKLQKITFWVFWKFLCPELRSKELVVTEVRVWLGVCLSFSSQGLVLEFMLV